MSCDLYAGRPHEGSCTFLYFGRMRNASPPRKSHTPKAMGQSTLLCAMRFVTVAALASGPRAAELQDQWIASSNWNALAMVHSPLANPAILTKTDFISIRASLSSIPDSSYAHELGVTFPIGIHQSVGTTWMMHAFNRSTPVSTASDNLEDKANLWLLSYAVNPLQPLSIGINLNVAHQAYSNTKQKAGFGADIGVAFDLLRHPALGDHSLGISLGNVVAPTLGDTAFVRVLKAALLSSFMEESIENSIEFSLADPFAGGSGDAAASFAQRWRLDGRITYVTPFYIHFHALYGLNLDGLAHIGAACGFDIPAFDYAKERDAFSLSYQHCWLVQGDASAISLYTRVEAGKHRLNAAILLEMAFAFYRQQEYWDALLAFGRVIAEYPNYDTNDVALYHMAHCELVLGMDSLAAFRFGWLPEQFPNSSLIHAAALGLMTVAYGNKDYGGMEEQFSILNSPQAPDSIRYHGLYLMAHAHMQQKHYADAIPLLVQIPKWHPDHVYAQHSAALAYNATGHVDSAVQCLEKAVRIEPATVAEHEIANRSRLMLGYLYYENASHIDSGLAKATLALRKVPIDSYFFDEALLGLGWTSFKAAQWEDCIKAAQELARSDNRILQAEGLLLKAYVFYAQKQYEKAIKVLKEAESAIGEAALPSRQYLDSLVERSEELARDYESGGDEMDRLAVSKRMPRVRRAINTSLERQKRLEHAVANQVQLFDNAKRQQFLGRNRAKLKEDIQYTLASATYLLQSKTDHDTLKPSLRQQAIERKIKRQEEQLERLEKEE